ncbi:UNVERIFIED_ORG: hypothetical protein LHJ69_05410 [Shinella sp. XGS7]|nr:hypothetical protein [Shinella sp. XGS7]
MSNKEIIQELRSIIAAQQELLRMTLWVMCQGAADSIAAVPEPRLGCANEGLNQL